MQGTLYVASPLAPWTFLGLTVVLGGAAAYAAGRSLALTWRPLWQALPYMLVLAAAVGFLHYVLFSEVAVPMGEIIDAALQQDWAGLAAALRFYGVIFAVLMMLAIAGYAITRSRQMSRQYGFVRDRV
ncbi:hypothetical protein PY365_24650 [Roseiarcaceae bacterium H3SJ34-1]|uniref:DUF6867 family protein n=1 Tax=Terripilifer ovatus TaxID=3032367 RepID=UPI003AB9A77B|nr:hypothetical protein [Roseiarcaceae bacterium H3SJ34-1]